MEQALIIFFGGLFAGFVGALTGGAGMFTIPMMMFVGLPPHTALANNKLGAIGVLFGSLFSLREQKFLPSKSQIIIFSLAIVGSYLGAKLLLVVSPEHLKPIVGWIIAVLLPLSVFFKNVGIKSIETSFEKKLIGFILFGLTSVMCGFSGAGMGVVTMMNFMFFFGLNIFEARANMLIPHLLMSITSLIVFIVNGVIAWIPGIALLVGMMIGGYLGANYGIKKGAKWVKGLFQAMILLMGLSLIFGF